MAIERGVLLAELLMSADRAIETAKHTTPVPGEWPPATVLGHLALNDTQNWSPRVALMVNAARAGQAPPAFEWFEPDGGAVAAMFAEHSLEEAAAELLSSRSALIVQLRDLAPGDWDSRADHAVFGSLDVRELILHLLGHDEEHRGGMVLGPDVSLVL